MPKYELYDLPQHTWDAFKARCLRDGWHIKALFLQLMDDYGAGRISPSVAAEGRPSTGFFEFTCSMGHTSRLRFTKPEVRAMVDADEPIALHCYMCMERLAVSTQDLAHMESWAHTPDMS